MSNDKHFSAAPALGVAVGSALVRAAKKRRRLADKTNAADREYGQLLEARYGWSGEELNDELVEVIDYGGDMNQRITLRWLDEQMAKIGLKPNSDSQTQGLISKTTKE